MVWNSELIFILNANWYLLLLFLIPNIELPPMYWATHPHPQDPVLELSPAMDKPHLPWLSPSFARRRDLPHMTANELCLPWLGSSFPLLIYAANGHGWAPSTVVTATKLRPPWLRLSFPHHWDLPPLAMDIAIELPPEVELHRPWMLMTSLSWQHMWEFQFHAFASQE
jgi:hypothetical protein